MGLKMNKEKFIREIEAELSSARGAELIEDAINHLESIISQIVWVVNLTKFNVNVFVTIS
jgi:hypothetical protein